MTYCVGWPACDIVRCDIVRWPAPNNAAPYSKQRISFLFLFLILCPLVILISDFEDWQLWYFYIFMKRSLMELFFFCYIDDLIVFNCNNFEEISKEVYYLALECSVLQLRVPAEVISKNHDIFIFGIIQKLLILVLTCVDF